MQLFIVILKFPSGEINTKLFLYDPLHDNCGNAIDYNIFAMYQKEGNRLLKSNLRHLLRVKKDIQLKGSPGNQLLQLARLYHNGTANAAEIINYQQKGMELDTSSIQFNWIWIR